MTQLGFGFAASLAGRPAIRQRPSSGQAVTLGECGHGVSGGRRWVARVVRVLPHDLSRSRGRVSGSPHGPRRCGLSGARGGRAAAGGAAMSAYGGPAAPPEPPRRYDPAGAGPAGPPSAAMRARLDRGGCVSVSAVYADINVHRPPAYWDYDMMSVPWGSVSQRRSPSVCVWSGGVGEVLQVDVLRLGLACRALDAGFPAPVGRWCCCHPLWFSFI